MKMPKKKITAIDIALVVILTALVVLSAVGIAMSLDR